MKNLDNSPQDKETHLFKFYTIAIFILSSLLLIFDSQLFATTCPFIFLNYFFILGLLKTSNASECMHEESKSDTLPDSENSEKPLSPGVDLDEDLQNINTIYKNKGDFDINKNQHINDKWAKDLGENLSINTIIGLTAAAITTKGTGSLGTGLSTGTGVFLETIYTGYKDNIKEQAQQDQIIIKTDLGGENKIIITNNEKLE